MKTIISFGKVGYYSNRKINEITVELELKQKECINFETGQNELMWVFTACGNVWDSKHSDIISGGQIIDELIKICKNPLLKEIHDIWREFHLNNLKAGLKEHCEIVDLYLKENNLKYDYKIICEYLKSINKFEINGIKYDCGWYCKPIPHNVVNRIIEIIETH